MNLERKITVIVTTYERPDYLKRSMGYWSKAPFDVIVADGSSNPYSEQTPSNIKYFHQVAAPGLTAAEGYAARLVAAVTLTNSPYIAQCAEDDFLSFSGIQYLVNFLEENPDYVAAHGWGPSFQCEPKSSTWKFPNLVTKPGEMAVDSQARIRMQQICSPFAGVDYSVVRSDAFKASVSTAVGLSSFHMVELTRALCIAMSGKFTSLPVFYQAREEMLSSLSSHIRFDRWMARTENSATIGDWKALLSGYFLRGELTATNADAFKSIDEALETHLKYLSKTERGIFKENLPGYFRHALRKLIPSIILRERSRRRSETTPTTNYDNQFRVILQSHNETNFDAAFADWQLINATIDRYIANS